MSEIRKYFDSRWTDGVLLELDFSQLEIFVLAYMTGDKQLQHDLLSGADLHGISATNLFGKNYTKAQRKIAKGLSFQLQYGAGYKSMAANNGVGEDVAKDFIKQYYDRYPGVKRWQDDIAKKVNSLRSPTSRKSPKGYPVGRALLESETGRRYHFYEFDAPDWMAKPKYPGAKVSTVSFSPTQMKNYPVQGYATADIVPIVIGKLYRALLDAEKFRDSVLLVNTVHDSVVFDCKDMITAKEWAPLAARYMENAPTYLKEDFGIDFNLPLKVEAEAGYTWHDMKPLTLT
jgi:DNA polymerase-1